MNQQSSNNDALDLFDQIDVDLTEEKQQKAARQLRFLSRQPNGKLRRLLMGANEDDKAMIQKILEDRQS